MALRRIRFRIRTRRRLVVLTVLALLLQQLAMASYACTLPVGNAMADVQMAAMSDGEGCAQMQRAVGVDRALCLKHCAPDASSNPDVRAPSVPLSLLADLAPLMPAQAPMSVAPRLRERAYLSQASPPPTILFCTLLI